MEKPLIANVHPDMVPTDSDRFWFNFCRTIFGSVVLGLTAMFTLFTVQPLFMERAMARPPPPPTPAQPFTLWSDEDTEAAWSILLISGGQAVLIGALATCYWLRKRRLVAASLAAAAAKELRRAKRAKKPRSKREKTEEPVLDAAPVHEPAAEMPDKDDHRHDGGERVSAVGECGGEKHG